MVTITITPDEGRAFSFKADDFRMEVDHGIAIIPQESGIMRPEPNGQSRLLLKAWRGCINYDLFTTAAPDHSKPAESA